MHVYTSTHHTQHTHSHTHTTERCVECVCVGGGGWVRDKGERKGKERDRKERKKERRWREMATVKCYKIMYRYDAHTHTHHRQSNYSTVSVK